MSQFMKLTDHISFKSISEPVKRNLGIAFIVSVLFGILLWGAGCSASQETGSLSAEKRFEEGMKKFIDEDYLEAFEDFRIVALQYQGSALADDAQFYLGESRFKREEYILAAYEYEVLTRTMPTSAYVGKARFKRALCYSNLSPKSYLDQEYTKRAIDEFQSFIEYHPTDSLVSSAEEKIRELNTKLAKKEFENGTNYMTMEYYKAAIISFDHILEKYHDTPYAEQAQLKKAEALYWRNRLVEASQEIEKFLMKYPSSSFKADAEKLRQDIVDKSAQKNSSISKDKPSGTQTSQRMN